VIRNLFITALLGTTVLANSTSAWGGQVPAAASAPDVPTSHHDRVYAAEQFSNTVSVIDRADNKLLGVIRLGEPSPMNFSPPYKGQVFVHGMGFSPDHHHRRGVDRVELRHIHRYGDQRRKAHDLCWLLAA
jgi:YVTN family beta-propeller protein